MDLVSRIRDRRGYAQVIRIRLPEVMAHRARATRLKVTYARLSKQTGISRSNLVVAGPTRASSPRFLPIDGLCTALECSLGELLERTSDSVCTRPGR